MFVLINNVLIIKIPEVIKQPQGFFYKFPIAQNVPCKAQEKRLIPPLAFIFSNYNNR